MPYNIFLSTFSDPNEILSNSRSLNFYHYDKCAFINPRQIFLSLVVSCQKEDGNPILFDDMVSCAPHKSLGLIDDVSITLGETTLDRPSSHFSLINYIKTSVAQNVQAIKKIYFFLYFLEKVSYLMFILSCLILAYLIF